MTSLTICLVFFVDCSHGLCQPGLQDRRSPAADTRRDQRLPSPTANARQKVSIFPFHHKVIPNVV